MLPIFYSSFLCPLSPRLPRGVINSGDLFFN
nr:MAG TPA: hypothetical protein [Caudoviricetes sp.]